MHLGKACLMLSRLVKNEPADLLMYAKAAPLLTALLAATCDDNGTLTFGYVSEKVHSAQGWLQILCGIGEDGNWSPEELRSYIYADISRIESNLAEDGRTFRKVG